MIHMEDGEQMIHEASIKGRTCRAELRCEGETVYLSIEATDSDGTRHEHLSTFRDINDFSFAIMSAFVTEWVADGLPRGEAP